MMRARRTTEMFRRLTNVASLCNMAAAASLETQRRQVERKPECENDVGQPTATRHCYVT